MRHEGNPNNPHSLIIHFNVRISEQTEGGHFSPNKIREENRVYAIRCNDRDQAHMRLTQLLEELQSKWPA